MAAKLALFLALVLLFAAAAHGHCGYDCQGPVIPKPQPPVVPTPSTNGHGKCLRELKLKVCANVLGLVKVGLPRYEPCCSLLDGLVDFDAAVCLCTAIKANVFGIKLNIPVDLSLILNNCRKICPENFECPN